MLALVVEHVLLLAVEILEREAVDGELAALAHPLLYCLQRDLEQLGIEPRARLVRLRKEDLHLLAACVDRVVALILVVFQRREIPDLVCQLPDVVGEPHRREQTIAAGRERSLERRVVANLPVELIERLLPRVPVGKNIRKVPLEVIGDYLSLAELRGGSGFGGRRHRPTMITRGRAFCCLHAGRSTWIIHVQV